MPERSPSTPSPGRRGFFRQAFLKTAGPVADAVESALPLPRTGGTGPQPRLRPPGALDEVAFLRTCFRSGNCMDACPANAIQPLKSSDPNQSGTPVIIPSQRACVVCESLACMDACPSGALRKVGRTEIRVGLAAVRHDTCVRSRGDDCVLCIERCPIGRTAIGLLEDGRVGVSAAGCVGCGVCEEVCPTTPKAIVVRPLPTSSTV